MVNKNKGFRIFVIIFVTLIGMGFGTWAGLVYSDFYWWTATIVGAISSYFLAQLYLNKLNKMSANGHNKKTIWLAGTFVAIIFGMICTVIIHVLMGILSITILPVRNRELDVTDDIVVFVLCLGIAQLFAIVAGFVVGGICSLIYLSGVKEKSNEVL